MSGARTAGLALDADVAFDGSAATGTAPFVLGAEADGVFLIPSGDHWLLVDGSGDGVTVEPLGATDFSRPLARVELATDAQGYTATNIEVSITRSLSILSQVATLGGIGGNLRWRRDY